MFLKLYTMPVVVVNRKQTIYPEPPYKFKYDDGDNIIIPSSQGERQEFLEALYDMILEPDKPDTKLIKKYDEAAEAYNKTAGSAIYSSFKSIKMATKKKAAKKPAPKKKAAAKKSEPKKPAVPQGSGKPSQKEQIVKLAEAGKTVDEIVEATGIQKPNVSSIYSRLGLKKYLKK